MHVFFVDRKSEDVHVVFHSVFVRTLRDDLDPQLIEEAKEQLGYGTSVLLCHLLKTRFFREIHSSKWAPCLRKDIVRTAEVQRVLLKVSDVKLQLVDHRDDLAVIKDHLKMMRQEVTDTDRAALALFIEFLHGTPGVTDLLSPLKILWIQLRPVDQIQVDIVVSKVPVRHVIETAKKVLYTGHIGDGKIFVYDVENVVKVRTGEEGYDALQDVE